MNEEYLNKIKEVLSEKAGVEPEEVHEDAYFDADLNIGDLELAEIYTELEDHYQVELGEEKASLETVEDLLNLLVDRLE